MTSTNIRRVDFGFISLSLEILCRSYFHKIQFKADLLEYKLSMSGQLNASIPTHQFDGFMIHVKSLSLPGRLQKIQSKIRIQLDSIPEDDWTVGDPGRRSIPISPLGGYQFSTSVSKGGALSTPVNFYSHDRPMQEGVSVLIRFIVLLQFLWHNEFSGVREVVIVGLVVKFNRSGWWERAGFFCMKRFLDQTTGHPSSINSRTNEASYFQSSPFGALQGRTEDLWLK